jgi:hypothetical protein
MIRNEKILYVSWFNPENSFIYPVARLLERDFTPRFSFAYIMGAQTAKARGFEPFMGFDDMCAVYESDELFPLFANRLVVAAREKEREFASVLDLVPAGGDSFLALASGPGRRSTEKLELFGLPEIDRKTGSLRYHFLTRGIRHVAFGEDAVAGLSPGQELLCLADWQNPNDPHAVVLRTATPHQMVGFMPHYLGEEVARLKKAGASIRVTVERVNPSPAPRHQRLMCVLNALVEPGFRPFSADRYRPLNVALEG